MNEPNVKHHKILKPDIDMLQINNEMSRNELFTRAHAYSLIDPEQICVFFINKLPTRAKPTQMSQTDIRAGSVPM